jgi:hypothetical protein
MSKRALLAAAGALCVLSVGGFAYAAIPSGGAGGTINGCYQKNNGQLRVIDAEAGDTCRKSEIALSWSQNGQRGATGLTGARGPTGPQGAPGARGATGQQGVPGSRGPTGQTGTPGQKGATGEPGVKGDRGPTGPPGANGAPGANGVSGYQLVSSAIITVPNGGTTRFASASCPTGKKVVGGGWDNDAVKDVFVVQSTPNASGTAWLGTIQNNSVGSVQAVLTAACVNAS